MCGKTGTAQVRRIASGQRGQGGDWKYRDHGLFVFFAPYDKPRYAGSVVIDHGMGGARAAAPVAKDVLTYLFDKPKAIEALALLEEGWGGDIKTRMAAYEARWLAANKPGSAAAASAAAKAGGATAKGR
jgi:penicillin-binding protein 2